MTQIEGAGERLGSDRVERPNIPALYRAPDPDEFLEGLPNRKGAGFESAPTKSQRSRYYDIVHAFRAVHESHREEQIDTDAQAPAAVIDYFNAHPKYSELSKTTQQNIEFLSKPDTFMAIRRAGRMRAHGNGALDEEIMSKLCREIRAACVWRALLERTLIQPGDFASHQP